MKRFLYILLDIGIIYSSILFTFYLFGINELLEDYQRNFDAFMMVYPYIGILYLILLYTFGLYSISRKTFYDLIYTVFLISVSMVVGIMGICFFMREITWAFPRSVILISGLLYFILLVIKNIISWYIGQRTYIVKKIIVIGNESEKLNKILAGNFSKFYKIIGQYSGYDSSLYSMIKEADEVYFCSDIQPKVREKIFPICIKYNKDICFVPLYFDISIISSSMFKIGDIPAFRISNMGLSLEERFLKRSMDILFSFIALIISLPFAIITALLIKLDGGPVLYAQERVTLNGRYFKILKFRTMIPDAEKLSGPVLAGESDPRITQVGKWIRTIRLDELPQLINILKGEMSIVGPRPERPFFVEKYEKEIPEYVFRHKVKAGLTGFAQVEGKYNTTVENKLRYDLIYINRYSLLNDLLIMMRTVKILFMKESTEGVDT